MAHISRQAATLSLSPIQPQIQDMLSTARRAYRLAIVTLLHGSPHKETTPAVRHLADDIRTLENTARTRLEAAGSARRSGAEMARLMDCATAAGAASRIGELCVALADLAASSDELATSIRRERTVAEAETVAALIRQTAAAVSASQGTAAVAFLAQLNQARERLGILIRDELVRAPSTDSAATALYYRSLDEIVTNLAKVTEAVVSSLGETSEAASNDKQDARR